MNKVVRLTLNCVEESRFVQISSQRHPLLQNYTEATHTYIYIYIYICILRGFRTSGDAFRLRILLPSIVPFAHSESLVFSYKTF
jgi:hypothetical protein